MTTAIVAVQGAFVEHEARLAQLGETSFEVRQAADLERDFDRLILPGGESTVQSKLLHDLGLWNQLQELITGGLPVMGTCAGLILLAASVEGRGDLDGLTNEGDTQCVEVSQFKTLPVSVMRNGYGRQLGSFNYYGPFAGQAEIPMTFIRAPKITQINAPEVEVLSRVGEAPVAVRYKNQLGLAFHPELDEDTHIFEYFLSMDHENNPAH